MKTLLLLLLFWSTKETECPEDLKKILNDNISSMINKISKEKKFNLNCTYDHDNNPFQMNHKVKGTVQVSKKTVADFKFDFTSSLFDPFAYKKMDFNLCGSQFSKLNKQQTSKHLATKLSKYFKNIKANDIKEKKLKNEECFVMSKTNGRKLRKKNRRLRRKKRTRGLL